MNPKLAFAACDQAALLARAQLYRQIRDFFAARHVMEVETPILSQAAVTDVHLTSIRALRQINGQLTDAYLHTSPEFAMKRLLASGSGAIYQIAKVFRDDEHGRKHNSEFSMLEWYRPGFDLTALMAETTDLLTVCLPNRDLKPQVTRYKDAFFAKLAINPLQATLDDLKQVAKQHHLDVDLGDDRLAYLDLLFSHLVEPDLGTDGVVYLTDFPPEMAALAQHHRDAEDEKVAARFEVYIDGLELANGYHELNDAQQLRARFEHDNAERQSKGLPMMPIDEHLLTALPSMPPCAGIALGLDRVLMIAMNRTHLHDVLAFPAERA